MSAGTIADKVLALQQRKRDLFDAVVAGDASASGLLNRPGTVFPWAVPGQVHSPAVGRLS